MKPYPTWKYIVLIVALIAGALYALPNVFGDDPSVQITTASGEPLPADFGERIGGILSAQHIEPKASRVEGGQWIVRLPDEVAQLKAQDAIKKGLEHGYVVALNLAPKTPGWLIELGARPMALGLDLRGGVHFLLQVDIADARAKAVGRFVNDLPAFLRKKDIRYTARRQQGDAIVLEFPDAERLAAAQQAIGKEYPELALAAPDNASAPTLEVRLSEQEAKRIVDFAVRQNLTTLRNRVNQLGVAEPLVQRQGRDRIVVELPGVQDTTRVKDLLGATATLEYRAVDTENEAGSAASSGIIPPGDELFYTREGHRPALLRKDAIASGDNLVDAAATIDPETGGPAVSVTLDATGAKRMFAFTEKNVGQPMAVLYRETEVVTNYNAKGEPIRERHQIEDVISIATIRGVFGKRFQTTGLSSKEAHDLAILLRAGALAAPIEIVEERTVGPSLGADNIRQGTRAAILGFVLVAIFMVVYYSLFGVIADAALLMNMVLLVAVLSMIHATLTLPGIAGIVLTLGMAVDANVLINERIREELRAGNSPHAAIELGYDRAFLTIADANITTLFAAVALFALGSGPVKGFAVTLTLGLATSMFTAILGSRAIVQVLFGRRKLADVPV